MGQAKIRGTREERVAQAIVLRNAQALARSMLHRQMEDERRRQREAASAEGKKPDVLLVGAGAASRAMLLTSLAIAHASVPMMPLVASRPRPKT